MNTRWQATLKGQLAHYYGMLLHEAQHFDPAMRDIEAFLISSQLRVTGEVKVLMLKGNVIIEGVRSSYSMMAQELGTYGEQSTMWTGTDAKGFCNLYGMQSILSSVASQRTQG